MISQENQELADIAYVNSQIVSAYIELMAMSADNQLAILKGYSPPWNYAEFIKLQDKYQLGHNSVITNLNSSH